MRQVDIGYRASRTTQQAPVLGMDLMNARRKYDNVYLRDEGLKSLDRCMTLSIGHVHRWIMHAVEKGLMGEPSEPIDRWRK